MNPYLISFLGRTAFEKMTDLDYVGETYYTIRNLSLYECQGWCREEPECSAASFRRHFHSYYSMCTFLTDSAVNTNSQQFLTDLELVYLALSQY